MPPTISKDHAPVRRAVFLGSKTLGLSIFRSLWATKSGVTWRLLHPHDLDDPRSTFQQWQQTATELGVEIRLSKSKEETRAMLTEFEPDIAFVCGWYQLLDSESLGMLRLGAWGVHNSLLPKYRGGSPLNWSIINGDKTVGASVFQLSERTDAGGLLFQVRVENRPEDDISTILHKIETQLVSELPDRWLELIQGFALVVDQDESQATYSGQRIERDGLIDWSRNAQYVHNFVRAQTLPYPCAFSFLDNERLNVVRTRVYPGVHFGTPGQVLQRFPERGSVLVCAGGYSAIEILRVHRGNGPVAASDVIRSSSVRLTRDIPESP